MPSQKRLFKATTNPSPSRKQATSITKTSEYRHDKIWDKTRGIPLGAWEISLGVNQAKLRNQ